KLWHLTFVSAVTAVECNIVVAFGVCFYEKTGVFVFSTGILFYEISYIQLVILIVRRATTPNSYCSVWGASLQNTIFIVPVSAWTSPNNTVVPFVPAHIV